jgi:hypothetical protein
MADIGIVAVLATPLVPEGPTATTRPRAATRS